MHTYQHLLIATDAAEGSEVVAERGLSIAQATGARVTLLQVLEDLPANIPVDPVPPEGVDKIAWITDYTRDKLAGFAERHGLKDPEINVATGSVKEAILELAGKQDIDLIIVGAHICHGMAVLRPSTTDKVLHGAPCDVLAVHIER